MVAATREMTVVATGAVEMGAAEMAGVVPVEAAVAAEGVVTESEVQRGYDCDPFDDTKGIPRQPFGTAVTRIGRQPRREFGITRIRSGEIDRTQFGTDRRRLVGVVGIARRDRGMRLLEETEELQRN